jgi:CheY-like chemotaxis protein
MSSLDDASLTVLIIDDEPDICTVWSMLLEMEGMHVVTASNGAEGLAKASSQSPSVVLCDFMMPGMNGLEVCRAMRLDDALRDVPFILWSAARGIRNDAEADLVVEKPVHIESLLAQIKDVMDHRRSA